ncbi:F-box/LRR-repeat protein 2-like isoform X2 [Paramacrobiotus metropolitanus]|nr:F-box/LRR-repeat protein 2-like isoform X2 [Paramacrobiotus metropolitanus]
MQHMQETQMDRRRSSLAPGEMVDGGPVPAPSPGDRRRSTVISVSVNNARNTHAPMKTNLSINSIPEKILLHIFNFLEHKEICRLAQVSRKWRQIAYDNRLWQQVSFRPEFAGLIGAPSEVIASQLISTRFGSQLRYIELPVELITAHVFNELANKCPNLSHLVLDFSNAMQLHDFNDLNAFPAKLHTLCICLSDVIFMEGFMRKIYNFINSVQSLQLIGTYERVSEEEEEVHETVNITKLKSHTPNLKVINFYGVKFLDDSHIEAISSNCVHLECLCIKFCTKYTGSSLKLLMQRCRKMSCLLLEQTSLQSRYLQDVEWEKTKLGELDITSCQISTECLISVLSRIRNLKWFCAGFVDGFNDQVLESMMASGNALALQSVDFQSCDNLTEEMLFKFLEAHGSQLVGLNLSGIPPLVEHFWTQSIPFLKKIRILIMGTGKICNISRLVSKIHVDQIIDHVANNCPRIERLEIRWDPTNLRFSDKSSKFVDTLRVKAGRLRSLCLSDGEYFELVKSNFERAHRRMVVRTTVCCSTTLLPLLPYYKDLRFN